MAALVETIGRWDFAAFQWLRLHHWAWADALMTGLSDVARGGALWFGLAVLVALVYHSRWPAVVQVVLAVALSAQLTDHVAKPLFNRSRPFETYAETIVYGHRPTTRSLPSGHAANAIAGAYALTRLAPDARAVFWTVAALVAFSRVYIGVHYPLDVIAGALLGAAVAWFVVGGTRWRFSPPSNRRAA
jgi:undecaprenyl-diphosphatase